MRRFRVKCVFFLRTLQPRNLLRLTQHWNCAVHSRRGHVGRKHLIWHESAENGLGIVAYILYWLCIFFISSEEPYSKVESCAKHILRSRRHHAFENLWNKSAENGWGIVMHRRRGRRTASPWDVGGKRSSPKDCAPDGRACESGGKSDILTIIINQMGLFKQTH